MKKLYIIIRDCGDGSNSLLFTFSINNFNILKDAVDDFDTRILNEHDIESFQSGEGFQSYNILVSDEMTYESMGISNWSTVEYFLDKGR